ncbi:MAG: hypothetical protein M3436_02380 [Pseudomonadota bacterium]|nr:hypothetical protein [Pseudomonadota bacterium]
MKLVIQIALGVFLGALASQLVMDSWRSYHEQQAKEAEREKLAADERAGNEQMQRARELLMRQLQGKAEEDRRRNENSRNEIEVVR